MRTLCFLLAMAFMAYPSAAPATDTLMMATTTSTQDSGLLDYLQPLLLKETGINLKWVSTGTGKALEHGKNCDVDVLLVHAPGAELKMVEEGFAIDRRQIMYNDFVLVGPQNDPAGIRGKSVA
ncbi:MAG: substrate-binding domain-containing protein, partial [Betaproteobacteria bacterium]|nr:substrate-binding domain-containing protein [Betaproteobacteria bacterium]